MLGDANKATVTVSIGVVVTFVAGAYYAGLDAGKGHGKAEALAVQSDRIASIERSLAEASQILKHLAASQKDQGDAIKALDGRTATLVTDVQVLSSKIPKR